MLPINKEILNAIIEILELLSIIFCLNGFYRKKYTFSVWDSVLMVTGLTILLLANYIPNGKILVFIGYILFFLYTGFKFGWDHKRNFVNVCMCLVVIAILQLLISMIAIPLEGVVEDRYIILLTNALMLCVIRVLHTKGGLYKLSAIIHKRDWLFILSFFFLFCGALYVIITYKFFDFLRLVDFVFYGVWSVLIGFLAFQWQKSRVENKAKKEEIRVRKIYDHAFTLLLDSVRKRQHDFDNHINAIYSQHLVTKNYEELVERQREYCEAVVEENHFNKLLLCGIPVMAGFLYSKLTEAERKGIHTHYDIMVEDVRCKIPIHKLVEVLGVFLDNAIEKLDGSERKNLYVVIDRQSGNIRFSVENSSEYITNEEIRNFFEEGYSTKGGNRGLGLSKVREIAYGYDCRLAVYNMNRQDGNYICFDLLCTV